MNNLFETGKCRTVFIINQKKKNECKSDKEFTKRKIKNDIRTYLSTLSSRLY